MFDFFKKRFDFYLAGPMRGYPEGNSAAFLNSAQYMRDIGFSVWNPAEQNDRSMKFSQCMTNDIYAVIKQCYNIALLPGWENSLGANVEVLCAYVCGKGLYLMHYPVFELVKLDWKVMEKKLVLPFNYKSSGFRTFNEIDKIESDVLG